MITRGPYRLVYVPRSGELPHHWDLVSDCPNLPVQDRTVATVWLHTDAAEILRLLNLNERTGDLGNTGADGPPEDVL